MKVDIDVEHSVHVSREHFRFADWDVPAETVYVDRNPPESILIGSETETDSVTLEVPVNDVPKLIHELKQAWQAAQEGQA